MKKRKLLAVAFVGMTLLVSSCQKEESIPPASSSQSGEVELTKSEFLSKVADLKESELKNDPGFNSEIMGEYLDAIGKAVANNDGMEKVTLQTMLNVEEAIKNEVKVSLAKKGNSSEKSSWTYVPYPISKSMSFNDNNTHDAQGRFYTIFNSASVYVYILTYGDDEVSKWFAIDYNRFIRYIFGYDLPVRNIYLELYDRNDVKYDQNYIHHMRKGRFATVLSPHFTSPNYPFTGGTTILAKFTDSSNSSYFFEDSRAGAIYRFGVHY